MESVRVLEWLLTSDASQEFGFFTPGPTSETLSGGDTTTGDDVIRPLDQRRHNGDMRINTCIFIDPSLQCRFGLSDISLQLIDAAGDVMVMSRLPYGKHSVHVGLGLGEAIVQFLPFDELSSATGPPLFSASTRRSSTCFGINVHATTSYLMLPSLQYLAIGMENKVSC